MKPQFTSILRRLRRVVGRQRQSGLDDAQLLERFASHGEEAAFEVLVGLVAPRWGGDCRDLLLLFGPPGVGKSRCLREALDSRAGWLSASPAGRVVNADLPGLGSNPKNPTLGPHC